MACTLAESPSDPFHRKLRQLRCLHCRFDCYRVERTSSRAGVPPAEVQRLFTAHFFTSYRYTSIQLITWVGSLGVRTTESNLRLDPAHSPMADTILKRYEIKDVLASGISVVYRAFDSHSGHDVAVKTVRVLSNEDSASRTLRNEGQILKRLHHQNVIDVHDFGEFKKGRETFSFIVMPLLHGHTLDQMIGAAAKLESAVVVDVISQTCQGL